MRKIACVAKVNTVAWIGLIGGLAAGCSPDTQRFAQDPFSNPFASSEHVAAAERVERTSPPARAVAAVPRGSVQAEALPPIEPQPRSIPATPAYVQSHRVAAAPVTVRQGGWSAAGGSTITVGANDSLASISSRYGVPASAILKANGLTNASQVVAGRRIVIPVYNADSSQTAQMASPPKARLPEAPRPAFQRNAETLAPTRPHARPGQARTAAKPVAAPTQPVLAQKPLGQPVAPRAEAPVARPAVLAEKPAPAPAPQPESARATPAREPDQTASLPSTTDVLADFRWPARGRVIAGFGANGGNEGINIALPEGTPVKATEAGVVTYAGSEVKGYGNLVLIKHDNGYVSAYAHNAELAVRRGERVKRGQVIAKSGQTGNVTSPQLHFEIRKGQTPVDPIPFLSGS